MSTIGHDLLRADPAIDALIVYDSNPVAVAPQSREVAAGFAREDLFTVVLEHFQTDTADYADWLLPATTQLEHVDVVKPYGHLYVMANNAAIDPVGEALPNTEIFRRLARAMGFTESCFAESDEEIAAQAFRTTGPTANYDWQVAKRDGWQRIDVPAHYAPFADGGFPTPSGKCEFFSQQLADMGLDPLPGYVPPREGPTSNLALAARYPLAMISPPARNFLNSTFVNVQSLRAPRASPRWRSIRRTRQRAASRTAARCACSTTAANCRCARWSPSARGRAWWWRCRSGGKNSRATARTPMNSPARR